MAIEVISLAEQDAALGQAVREYGQTIDQIVCVIRQLNAHGAALGKLAEILASMPGNAKESTDQQVILRRPVFQRTGSKGAGTKIDKQAFDLEQILQRLDQLHSLLAIKERQEQEFKAWQRPELIRSLSDLLDYPTTPQSWPWHDVK